VSVFENLVIVILVIVLINLTRLYKKLKDDPAIQKSAEEIQLNALREIIDCLPTAALIVDDQDLVIISNANCIPLRLIAGERIAIPEMRRLNKQVFQKKKTEILDQLFIKVDPALPEWEGSIQISPIDEKLSLVLVNDLSEERRLNDVRRDFVANVSHELKTPVGALSILAEAVVAAGADVEQVAKFTDRMKIEVKRLNELITDLVELSEVQGDQLMGKFIQVSINSIIAEAVDSAKLLAQSKHVNLNVSRDNSNLSILGDQRQLVTALSNLITNAVIYSPEYTNVGVGTRVDGNEIEISVTDQGPGISESDQMRIFERFYRVDPARSRETGGTGLGLSIVKYICANHGGECSVWSQPGQGSTFTLRFPIESTEPNGKVSK
jgi:two-component system, OmpR family, sensor histidine kinase SenX3